VVDSTPPRIGSYTLSIGNILLFPQGTTFQIIEGAKIKFTISLETDTYQATLFINDQPIELEKNFNLWEKEISLAGAKEHKLSISAQDNLGNQITKKEIGFIQSIEKGQVLSSLNEPVNGAKITVFVFNDQNQSWNRWQAEAFGLRNPFLSQQNGEYELLLPEGKYYLTLQKTGFTRLRSSELAIADPSFINFDFSLEQREGLRGLLEDLLEKITF
jgi:hypothetical protein